MKLTIISSMMGNEILKIMVIMMTVPMLLYQSGVISLYLPCSKNPTSVISTLAVNFILRMIMINAMFMMSMNERLMVKLKS